MHQINQIFDGVPFFFVSQHSLDLKWSCFIEVQDFFLTSCYLAIKTAFFCFFFYNSIDQNKICGKKYKITDTTRCLSLLLILCVNDKSHDKMAKILFIGGRKMSLERLKLDVLTMASANLSLCPSSVALSSCRMQTLVSR